MLKKIKDFLGIEGVKIDLSIPETSSFDEGEFDGHIILTSLSDQTIKSFEISIFEKYQRGRKESTLINEYLIGKIELTGPLKIAKDEEKRIAFTIDFVEMKSEMDKMEGDNFIVGSMIKIAKWAKGVRSTFRVEAVAKMKNNALGPVISKPIKIS